MRLEIPGDSTASIIDAKVVDVSDQILRLECVASTLPKNALDVGMRVILRCWDSFGVYSTFTTITEVSSPTRIAVEATSPVEAGENRRFCRVNVEVPFSVSSVDGEKPASRSDDKAMSVDLSPGGLKFKTHTAFRLGDHLALRLPFAAQSIDLEGRVVRTQTPPDSVEWLISVEFMNTSDENQLKVVRLIYAEQQRAVRASR